MSLKRWKCLTCGKVNLRDYDRCSYCGLPFVKEQSLEFSIPRRLAKVVREAEGRYHPIAEVLGVNVYWVYEYLKRGNEPTNPAIRAKMFLPELPKRKKNDGRSGFQDLAESVQWWRKLTKERRDYYIEQAWKGRK